MDLPIDIHYAKMGEWLDDRVAVLGKKWPKEVRLLKAAAPTLTQRTKYEIPALKKAIQRWRAVGPEIDRQREEGIKKAASAVRQRADLLRSVGLPESCSTSLEVETALAKRVAVAATTYDRAAQRELQQDVLLACLEDFTASLSHGGDVSLKAEDVFPWLASRGETQHISGQSAENTTEDAPPEINWDDDDDNNDGGKAPVLDWGDDDAENVPLSAFGEAVDLSMVRGVGSTVATTSHFGALPQPGTSALHTDRARAAIADEIEALRGFLVERVLSLSEGAAAQINMDTTAMLKRLHKFNSGGTPNGIASDVVAARFPVEAALIRVLDHTAEALLSSAEVAVLGLAGSHQATERFLSQCEQLAFIANRAHVTTTTGDERKAEAVANYTQMESQLEALVAATKALQNQCEEALRRMFAPREVYIVGDINNL